MIILPLRAATGLCLALLLSFGVSAGPVPVGKPLHYPNWWFERDVIPLLPPSANKPDPVWPIDYPPADDYAAANIGQLKLIFSKAAEELNAVIPDPGAGPDVNDRVAVWQLPPPPGVARDDFAVLNQGQLKAISQIVYHRLRQVGYFGAPLKSEKLYPWGDTETTEDAYALVNVGQLKYIFSFFSGLVYFDEYLADTDLDEIPNGWETEHGLDPVDPSDAGVLSGGLTNLQIYKQAQNSANEPAASNPAGLVVYSP